MVITAFGFIRFQHPALSKPNKKVNELLMTHKGDHNRYRIADTFHSQTERVELQGIKEIIFNVDKRVDEWHISVDTGNISTAYHRTPIIGLWKILASWLKNNYHSPLAIGRGFD